MLYVDDLLVYGFVLKKTSAFNAQSEQGVVFKSISSPCHFYFVLYDFIALAFSLTRVRKHWWDDITQGKV